MQRRQPKGSPASIGGLFAEDIRGTAAVASSAPWPPVQHERAQWRIEGAEMLSQRQRIANTGTYRAAVPAEIAELRVDLSSDLQVELEEATAALIRLDQAADEALPGVEFAPLQSVLLRTESTSSSQIEGISASAKNLAIAELGESAGSNAVDVVQNVRAMDAAIGFVDEPSVETILNMHRELMTGHERHTPGRLRTEQVWIGGRSPLTADFVAPLPDRVPSNMDDLVKFIRRDDIPSLAHAALAHAQFETIHPFTDGNGRTGRALLHTMLRRADIHRRVTVPISAGILTNPRGYFDALTEYRRGDLRPILHTFAESSLVGAEHGKLLIEDLKEHHREMSQSVTARKDSSAHRLVDLLLSQPAVSVQLAAQRLGVSEVAATTAINRLVDDGVLAPASKNRRNRVWVAPRPLAALDDFAERIRRQP